MLLTIVLRAVSTFSSHHPIVSSSRYALAFVGIAAGAGITIAVKFYFLGLAGERLTERLRNKVFGVLVRQEVSYYDMPENSRGTLTSHLSTDAAAVRGILGDRLALVVQSVALIAGGCGVAFYFCPKVGAVVLGASPMVALGGEGWAVSWTFIQYVQLWPNLCGLCSWSAAGSS